MTHVTKEEALNYHIGGKIEIRVKTPCETSRDLSMAYTPGVAEPCKEIEADNELAYKYTNKANLVAVITDGTAVLGLGDIGAIAGKPVMEGKAVLFKKFANVDAFDIELDEHDPDKIVEICKALAPTFGGINLEDIRAPKCFEIERKLQEAVDIPVMHDDQHGTAMITSAGIINAMEISGKDISKIKIVVSGAGAAGTAIIKLLNLYGAKNIVAVDSRGIVGKSRTDLNAEKTALLEYVDASQSGSIEDAITDADVFIGVSRAGLLTPELVQKMAKDPIVFALANPVPEIMPDVAKQAGVAIIGTGRSDFPNQVNNSLAFPGIFRGALDHGVKKITDQHKLAAAEALANLVENPTVDKVVPTAFDAGVVEAIANVIR